MDLTQRIRTALAAVIAIGGIASIAAPSTALAAAPVTQLLPDLRTVEPNETPWLRYRVSKGSPLLRISNRIGNAGKGPFELRGAPDTTNCAAAGQYPGGEDLTAWQRLYSDSNPNGYYDSADSGYADANAGCFEYHNRHEHWHFQNFSRYVLRDLENGEAVAGPSQKIGFCIVDQTKPFADLDPPLQGVPDTGVYPTGSGCGDPLEPGSAMGLSIGYADTYTANTPGQRLAIPGIEKGHYCLVSTAVPDSVSLVQETDATNNARSREVLIKPAKKYVADLGDCPA
jgi:hypothetical protein